MTVETRTALLQEDRDHLVHPLQHPSDHQHPVVFVGGRGTILTDIDGKQYIDGLSSLWNVNVGHGRRELAEAAAQQMAELAFCNSYCGSSNAPAITLAARLAELAPPGLRTTFFTTGGAESNDTAFKTARFYWQLKGRPQNAKTIS